MEGDDHISMGRKFQTFGTMTKKAFPLVVAQSVSDGEGT